MSRLPWRLHPPAGTPISAAELWRVLRIRDPEAELVRGLREILGPVRIELYASGREALRVAFERLAAETQRNEVVLPAYCCFSVPAAAVAAGLNVRLVDVDLRGRIDVDALGKLPLERAAAIVVANLFGIPERIEPIAALAHAAGAGVIDDAAQALGARNPEGPAGARGRLGVLSFARGKPLSALGGGALVAREESGDPTARHGRRGARIAGVARGVAFDAALSPLVFPHLAAIPFLHVGETIYDPDFRRGAIDPGAVALAAALVGRVEDAGRSRARTANDLAGRIEQDTAFAPLLGEPESAPVFPRLALLAPSAEARDRALAALRSAGEGTSPMYPAALDEIHDLAPRRLSAGSCPGARDLARRLLTLPPDAGGDAGRCQRILEVLASG